MTLDKAIKKVGKAMGKTKYHNHMGGAMLPHGELGCVQTLSILFGVDYDSVESRLYKIMNAEFRKITKAQNTGVKKRKKQKFYL